VNAAADDNAAFANCFKSLRHEIADRREDDCTI